MTNSIDEIQNADLLFVIGSNTTEAHPIIAMQMKRAVRRGARLIVADPRKIWLTEIADQHLQLRPGTDVWLLNALANVIVNENLVDHEYIDTHTTGFDSVVDAVSKYTPERAEKITGVAAGDIRSAARSYSTTRKAGIYYTLGITEHTHGTDNVYALSNLVLMTGHLGVRSAGLNPLRGQNNVQGANDAGASPVFLPGYHRVDDDRSRKRFEEAWGVDIPHQPGLNLNEMMHSLKNGKLKGLFVMGEDLVISEPNASTVEEALNKCEFLVCQDILPNETIRFADVILPAACFAEKDGVFTNSDRRVQRVRKAVEPPGNARPDWQILSDLARAVGYPMPHYERPSDIYAEYVSLVPRFSGISHERIETEGGLQWPCPFDDHPGTATLHVDCPIAGTAVFTPVDYRPSEESPDSEYPLVLSTGRTLYHYNSATQTKRDSGTVDKDGRNFVEIHPKDARRFDISESQSVIVSSRRGEVTAEARIGRRVRPGCVWMPFHFSESRANLLTTEAGDSVTGTAEYKVCAVSLKPV
ncbi:MAG: molybdopterin-dependent oxidoreductase [Candidatus Latescibacteria bacterium]|jgi:formate dehydrogenase major subunit/formate dehydrogenase alpha subunit|nr:molybdopterin-dependent oxidoreductase [Candidatus Latescibacterota bacterium]